MFKALFRLYMNCLDELIWKCLVLTTLTVAAILEEQNGAGEEVVGCRRQSCQQPAEIVTEMSSSKVFI